ncbi:type II toxin-antitoxin system VapC family toxin [soil metagenome]
MLHALHTAPNLQMSAATHLEVSSVLVRRGALDLLSQFDQLIVAYEIGIIPFSHEQADIGRLAYQLYGRGTGHSAGLNFGDCFSYALAKTFNEPLLFKGDDFIKTDLQFVRLDEV